MMCKKDIILFVSIFCVLALISGSTYAYWAWESDANKSVVFNTSYGIDELIVYDEGESHFVGDFKASTSYCNDTIYNTIKFNKILGSENFSVLATINMDVNFIGTNISAAENVYWYMIEGETGTCSTAQVVNSGSFNGVTSGTTIKLLSDVPVTIAESVYTIYIWVDSSVGDMVGETIDVNIWTQFDQVEYILGDLNGDGLIDSTDAKMIMQYSSKLIVSNDSGYDIEKVADVNTDGRVNGCDAEIIMKYELGALEPNALPFAVDDLYDAETDSYTCDW